MNQHRLAKGLRCRYCYVEITPRISDLKRGRGVYCGRACSNKYLAKYGRKRKSLVHQIIEHHPFNKKFTILACSFANFSRSLIFEAVISHFVQASQLADRIIVNSGGISVSLNDETPFFNHELVARIHQRGINYIPHEPKFATDEMLRKADLILVSDMCVYKSIQERLERLYPRYLRGTQKILLFADLYPRIFGAKDIEDPARSHELSCILIDRVIATVKRKLLPLFQTFKIPRS